MRGWTTVPCRMKDHHLAGCRSSAKDFKPVRWVCSCLRQKLAQARRGLLSIQPAGRHVKRQGFPSVRLKLLLRQQPVFAQKYQAGGQRGALIPIYEGVVPANVKK